MLIPNLAVLLAERRLTISKVSQDTGISRTTLTALAGRSARGAQFDTLDALCQYLKIAPDALFIYLPFDLSMEVPGLPGRTEAAFTVTRAGRAPERFALTCDAEILRAPDGHGIRALRVRLSPPEGGDAGALIDLLRALPPSVLADLERDLLAAFDRNLDPALVPDDYSPDLRWPWQ